VFGKDPLECGEIVERHDAHEVGDRLWDALARRARRIRRGAELVDGAEDRHEHRVVVAVVAAFELDDEVAAGGGAHQMDRIHRRFGPGVVEPPLGQPETLREKFRDRHDVGGRLGKVRALRDALLHGTHDGWVRVSDDVGPVTGVEVDVTIAVHVPDVGPFAALDPDRNGPRTRPTGGDTAWDVRRRTSVVLNRSRNPCEEVGLFGGDSFVQVVHQE